MNKKVVKSVKEMHALAHELAHVMKSGELYALDGDLGAGKTTFTQGVLESLGAEGPYTSPTFTIVRTYELAENSDVRTIYHIDAYRIDEDGIMDIGWEEMRNDPHALIIVEWPERIASQLPTDTRCIAFTWVDNEERHVQYDF